MRFSYPIDLTPTEDGRVLVHIPDVIGCVTDGDDPADALIQSADALEEALAAAMDAREDLPMPSPAAGRPTVAPGAVMTAKAALYQTMRARRVTNVALAATLGIAETEVRRMLDPKYNSGMGKLETALAALGKRLEIEVRDAA